MSAESQVYSEQELTAIFFALAGMEIQRCNALAGGGVSPRRLFKTIANCIWDYSFLPRASGDKLLVSKPGDLIWTPHRFGALGLIKPSRAYNCNSVRVSYGSFYYPQDILHRGTYQKYGIRTERYTADGMRFVFPEFISYEAVTKSGIERIDQTLWPELVRSYARLNSKTVNCLASCRNAAAAIHSLWVELVFFFDSLRTVCRQLEDMPIALEAPESRRRLDAEVKRAYDAGREYEGKIELWRFRDEAVTTFRSRGEASQLDEYIPVLDSALNPPVSLPQMLSLAKDIKNVNCIVGALLRRVGLGPCEAGIVELEECCDGLGLGITFKDVAELYYGPDAREIAGLCLNLSFRLKAHCEEMLGVTILAPPEHYSEFFEKMYPI